MTGGSRSDGARLRLVHGTPDRRAPTRTGPDGLNGCDPRRFVLLGSAHDRRRRGDGAYPVIDERGALQLLPGETRLSAWPAHAATTVKRAPGSTRVLARRRWRGTHGLTVTLTDRRLVLHGLGADGDSAHIDLERIAGVRATTRRTRGTVHIGVLLHRADCGTSAELTLTLTLGRRRSAKLLRALAAAHRVRWACYDLPGPVAAAIAVTRPQRGPRALRYDPVVHIPLGVSDAIRGRRAPGVVPQRQRAVLQAAARDAVAASANAPAISS